MPISEAVARAPGHRPPARRWHGGRYGRVRVWGSVGFIVSVALAGSCSSGSGVRPGRGWCSACWTCSLFAAVAAAAGRATPAHARGGAAGALAVLRQPEVAWFFAGVFLTVLAHTSLYAFFSLYLRCRWA